MLSHDTCKLVAGRTGVTCKKKQTRILELASSTLCCICLARAVHHKHSTAQQLRFGFFSGGVGTPGEHFIQTIACTAVRTWACVGPEKALKMLLAWAALLALEYQPIQVITIR